MSNPITVTGVTLEIEESGQGRPLLFLHPGEGLQPNRPWIEALARNHRVIAPHHPGFGTSSLPDWFGTADDIAYLYLDLAKRLNLKDAVLVGACFGGWIAAEMAVRDTRNFAGLVLAAPLGIKVGGVLDRDIADMHSIPRAEFKRRLPAMLEFSELGGLLYCRYGELSGRSRDGMTDHATMSEHIDVLGVQLKAGGVGVDLTRASHAIYFSLDFSLGDYQQSRKRVHRPGQHKRVVYTHLLAAGTVDEAIYGALSRRETVVNAVLADLARSAAA